MRALYLRRAGLGRGVRQLATQGAPRQREGIGLLRAYGRPVATLFLWSSLAYMSLQAVWSKLYFDEVRLETEARIDDLRAEVDALEAAAASPAAANLPK
ncbi:hypothetical protein H4R18_002692 [Coemansia javaensis]|uniref:Uncharacterized protein n=1 Tax=Coemansia javaensis TaxID=2761396 RepID=A0A9W8HBC4_9FUNG|nr:hypothetical protein H4R18_002692 [Coemansia javaensis]